MGTDLQKHFLKFTQDFQRIEAQKQAAVDNGDMTEEEFAEWRKNKLLYGMHWRRLVDRNTNEMLKYNQTAIRYINGEVPQIYASGYNSVAEQIPDSPVAGFDFELINADTVKNLIHEKGIILPPKKKVDPEKDKTWNAKQINAQLLQGIMAGESIPDIAKRMQKVANADLVGATRTARTMHTAAQNAGRQSGYNRAKEQGIIFVKTWLAAVDQYTGGKEGTRYTHYKLHGTTIPCDEKFVTEAGNELEFPGDWRAPGEEVYNCRCTMITKFQGFNKLKLEETAEEQEEKRQAQQKQAEAEQPQAEETSTTEIRRATTRAEAEEILFGENGIFDSNSNVKKMCKEMAIATANVFSELENKFGILKKHSEHNYRNRKPTFNTRRSAIAACYLSSGDMEYAPKYFKNADFHKETVLKQREFGFFMDFADDKVLEYAFTHEYGHAVEGHYVYNVLKRGKDAKKAFKEIKDEINDILKKNHPDKDSKRLISEYGMTNAEEFFAEAFANSQCGAPNELGEAMTEWLKEKGLLK